MIIVWLLLTASLSATIAVLVTVHALPRIVARMSAPEMRAFADRVAAARPPTDPRTTTPT